MKIEKCTDVSAIHTCGLIYAQPGSGKTTALALQPGRKLIIDIDRSSVAIQSQANQDKIAGLKENAGNIDIIKVGCNMRLFEETLAELEKGAYKDYDLICVDNLSELENQMLIEWGKTGKNDGAPEQRHYLLVQFKLVDYINRFRSLDTNVIFTAWEDLREVIDPSGEKYTKLVPLVARKHVDEICGKCNVVAHLETILDKDGNMKYYFRMAGDRTMSAKDQIYGRRTCKINELIKVE